MAERAGKAQLQSALIRFCRTWGFHPAQAYNDVGGILIDRYNGYVLEVVSNSGGGVHQPFGGNRRTAAQLIDCINFANDAKNYLERGS